jgi:hypothetical protein
VRGGGYCASPEDSSTLTSAGNLARSLWNQGKYAEAEGIGRETVNDELLQLRELRDIFTNTERTISMFRAMPPRAPNMVRCLRRLSAVVSGKSPTTDCGGTSRCKRAPRHRQALPPRSSQCPQLDDGCGYTSDASDASDALSSASTPGDAGARPVLGAIRRVLGGEHPSTLGECKQSGNVAIVPRKARGGGADPPGGAWCAEAGTRRGASLDA